MSFTPDEILWIESCIESGDTPEEIAENGGYPVWTINDLLRDAQHPARALSEFHRDVLSLWASGASRGQITVAMGLSANQAQTALEYLRRRALIWPQEPGRAFLKNREDERAPREA